MHRSSLFRHTLLAGAAYVLMAAALFHNWLPLFSSHIAGDEKDGALTFYQSWWPVYALLEEHPATYLDGVSFHPLRSGYAFSDMMIGLWPFLTVARLIVANEILIYNSLHLLFFLALPLAIFYRARRVLRSFLPALAAGTIGLAPFFFDQLLHFQLAPVFPLALLPVFYRRLLFAPFSSLLKISLALVWLAMVSPHLFLFGLIYAAILTLMDRNRKKRLQRLWMTCLSRWWCWQCWLWLALTASVLFLTLWPYQQSGNLYHLKRLPVEIQAGALELQHVFLSPELAEHEKKAYLPPAAIFLVVLLFFRRANHSFWLSSALSLIITGGLYFSFKGFEHTAVHIIIFNVIFVFIATKAILAWRKACREKFVTGFFSRNIWTALLLLWLALGPLTYALNFHLPGPYAIFAHLPGFDRIRAVSRLAILFFLETGLLLGAGLLFFSRTKRRHIKRPAKPGSFGSSPAIYGHPGATGQASTAFATASIVITAIACIISFLYATGFQMKPRFALKDKLALLDQKLTGVFCQPGQNSTGNSGKISAGNKPCLWPDKPVFFYSSLQDNAAGQALLQIHAMQNQYRLAGGYTGIRIDHMEFLSHAARQCARKNWPLARCQQLADQTGLAIWLEDENGMRAIEAGKISSAEACCHTMAPEVQIRARQSKGQALLFQIAWRQDFCLEGKIALHDRHLTVSYQGPENLTAGVPISTPPYQAAGAPWLWYAARAPEKRGRYAVEIKEGPVFLYRGTIEVR